jgi:hypothetical protein
MMFYGVLFWRALRTFRLTRRGGDLLVAVGIVWLAAALPAALLLSYRNLGWWLGHAFEIVGIAAVGFTVAVDLHRGAARSRPLLGDLTGADLVAEEEAFLGSHIRALLVALAEKDAYTEEHTRRVALRAVQVGDELGLAPERLRELAVGGLLHDIGKLSVPDEILKKPGSLTESELSGSMRPVIRTRRTATRCRSTYGSSLSATSTTPFARRVCTGARGLTSARFPSCGKPPDVSSTGGASKRSNVCLPESAISRSRLPSEVTRGQAAPMTTMSTRRAITSS